MCENITCDSKKTEANVIKVFYNNARTKYYDILSNTHYVILKSVLIFFFSTKNAVFDQGLYQLYWNDKTIKQMKVDLYTFHSTKI